MKKASTFYIHKTTSTSKVRFGFLFLSVTLVLIFFTVNAFGYDFSDIRRSLKRDLEIWQGNAKRGKIAVVYNYSDREQIKKQYNLILLKKDLSHELLKSFDVADPIIVQEIIKTNRLEYNQLTENKYILKQFATRADSPHILFVDLQTKPNNLLANITLVNQDKKQISKVITEIQPERKDQTSYHPQIVAQKSEPEPSVYQTFDMDFTSRKFTAGQNDSWMYFSPTAMVNPETHAVDLVLWFKDVADVDIRPVRLRYDIRFLEVLQFGLQTYAIAEKQNAQSDEPNLSKESGHHSTYISLKYQIVDETVLPFNLAIGIRQRILWDTDNTDYRSRDRIDDQADYDEAEERDEKNNRYNQLTLQAMITGKIEPIGILYSLYVDSMTLGTGIKFILTPDIKLLVDSVYYYYEDPEISNDVATGIQFYNAVGSTDIMYQFETAQVQLGFNVNF